MEARSRVGEDERKAVRQNELDTPARQVYNRLLIGMFSRFRQRGARLDRCMQSV